MFIRVLNTFCSSLSYINVSSGRLLESYSVNKSPESSLRSCCCLNKSNLMKREFLYHKNVFQICHKFFKRPFSKTPINDSSFCKYQQFISMIFQDFSFFVTLFVINRAHVFKCILYLVSGQGETYAKPKIISCQCEFHLGYV